MTELTFSLRRKNMDALSIPSHSPMWPNFWESFPYGDLVSSQGQYQNSVEVVLERLPPDQQTILLDLLDLQWVVFVEQLAILSTHQLVAELEGKLDTADARLQINSNLRGQFRLPGRNLRNALMAMPPGSLIEKIEAKPQQGTP